MLPARVARWARDDRRYYAGDRVSDPFVCWDELEKLTVLVGTIEEAYSHAQGLDLVVTCAEMLQRGLAPRELTDHVPFTFRCASAFADGLAGQTRIWFCHERAGRLDPVHAWRVFWPIERLDDVRAMLGPHVMAPQR